MKTMKPRTQVFEFGRDFEVGTEWTFLTGRKPPYRRSHSCHVYLKIQGYEFDATNVDDLSTEIQLEGRRINPIIQVIDSKGNRYSTEDTTRIGRIIGLAVRLGDEGYLISSDAEEVQIAIRSDEKFQCRSIGFCTHLMK